MIDRMLLHTTPCERDAGISRQTSTVLDVLRVFSAHMVLIGHGLSLCGLTFLQKQVYFPYIQNIGVVLLLLISGYLMGLKIKVTYCSGKLNAGNCAEIYKEFILNKASRIYVGLVPALIIIWMIDSYTIFREPRAYSFYSSFTFSNFLASLTMVQKMPAFGKILYFGSAPQIWTLSVEWWMFVLCGYAAFCVLPIRNAGCLRIKHLLVLLTLSYPIIQYLYFGKVPVSPIIWALGVLIYFLQERLKWNVDRMSWLLLLALNLIILIQIGIWKKDAYCIEFILGAAVLFLLLTTVPEKTDLVAPISKFFKSAASTTYSLYLLHYSIMEYFVRVHQQMAPVKKFWLMILVSEVAAVVFSLIFENKGKLLSKRLISVMRSKKTSTRTAGILGVLFLYSIAVNSPMLAREVDYGFKGKGTKDSPYVIESAEGFIKFRDLVNSGESFSSMYFYQSKDLDLAGTGNWEPIGIYGSGAYFAGNYDGGGHVIHNLTCETDDGLSGLFGMLIGEVCNLGIESGSIRGSCVGAIASHGGKTAAIINCYNKADVYGTIRAGGIADNFAGDILFCVNLGEVSCEIPENAVGLVSYDCAALVYSYTTQAPAVSSGFSGSLIKSHTISLGDLNEKFLEERYRLVRSWLDGFGETENVSQMILQGDSIYMYPKRFITAAQVMWILSLISACLIVAIYVRLKFQPSKQKNNRKNFTEK